MEKKNTPEIWMEAYCNGDHKKRAAIRNFIQSVWALLAERSGFTMFDQEADLGPDEDESDHPLFEVRLDDSGLPVRHYLKEGDQSAFLFCEDIYDELLIGNAIELLEDYNLEELILGF